MENTEKLMYLKNRNKELHSIVFVGFETSEELKNYRNDNLEVFKEYQRNYEEIQALEWELMTPEERERKLEVARKIKAKTSGNQNQ